MTADPQAPNPDPTQDLGQSDDPEQAAEPAQSSDAQATTSSPSISSGGSTSFTPMSSLTGEWAIHMNAGTDGWSLGSATYWPTSSASTVTTELTIAPAPDAAFQFLMLGSGLNYATKQLRLQRVPGSDALQAMAGNTAVDCGPLPSNQATPVVLSWDQSSATFDVLINGAPSACMNVATRMIGPVRGFRIIDQPFDGYGGQIDFTAMTLY